jgi:hypothetical protein
MYNLTREQLEEMVICIVQCHLDEDEAMEYALSMCGEFTWPDESRIDIIGTNGNDGLHYGKAVEAGVYDS